MSVLLALDLATFVGFAVGEPGGDVKFGSRRIGLKGCSIGEFGHAFDFWLSDLITVTQPDTLVFEAPHLSATGLTSIDTARKLMGLVFMAETIAYRREIRRVLEENSTTCTKWLTGRGKYKDRDEKKAAVMSECRRRGYEVKNSDEADAIALLLFTEDRLFPGSRKANAGSLFVGAA